MLNWTPYVGITNDRGRRRPRVSLCKEKRLTMNAAAWEALGRPEFVRFFYDAENKRVGVARAQPDAKFAFRMNQRANYPYRYAYVAAFCNHFGLHPKATIFFYEPEVGRDGIMALDLATAVTGPPKKK